MAQHTQEENTSCMKPMEEEEEEEDQRGDWPLLSVCAQEQDAPSVKPSFSVKSSSLRSRAEQEQEACGSGIRSLSFSKLFSFRIAKGASLDIDELAAAGDDADACAKKEEKQHQSKQQPVCRSQSLPMTSIRRFPQGYKKRVADSSSLSRFRVSSVRPEKESLESGEETEEEEEVGEEEAVCRICMVALWEGSVLKLECRCKGELALAHRDCALKWFSIKGNANCDVCSHDVLNLPVTLRRIHSSASATNAAAAAAAVAAAAAAADSNTGRGGGGGFRVWQHGTPILVIVSMLAYFCFLEQLLVGDHGTAALAISLPFAGALGLFSSLTTIKMVSRRYVWIYSAVQFLFIVLFTHLFYRYVRMQAVIAIILSTFAGFSVAICTNAMLLQIIRWRARPRRPPPSDLEISQP